MALAPQSLPDRFPCWCRATYSWGGENKGDLGFIEGDLIECLNAGDGSWWMGRLRRNKTTGLFPSNFVKVLDANFSPVSRGPSPAVSPSSSLSTPKATPQKSKTFRKPFQAYASAGSPRNSTLSLPTTTMPSPISRQSSVQQEPAHLSRQHSYQQAPSPLSRQASNNSNQTPSRQLSYMSPTRQGTHLSRPTHSASPTPSYLQNSRAQSPAPYPQEYEDEPFEQLVSSPPPPPPPHRVTYTGSSTRAPSPEEIQHVHPKDQSPHAHTPRPTGQTPSPLRDAMDGVMSSLDQMRLRSDEESPSPELEQNQEPLNPWSPEAFEELRAEPKSRAKRRPRSSLGIASSQMGHSGYTEDEPEMNGDGRHETPPELDNYVERMESRLRKLGASIPGPSDELFLPGRDSQEPPNVPPKDASYSSRPQSSFGMRGSIVGRSGSRRLRARKSAYELGQKMLDRTFSTKTSTTSSSSGVQSTATNSTNSTSKTSQSMWSGNSAGAFSAKSAGSYARRKWGSVNQNRPQSVIDIRQDALAGLNDPMSFSRPKTPSQYSNKPSRPASRAEEYSESTADSGGLLGGLHTPLKKKKSGFLRKLVDSAKAGAASTRSTIADGRVESQRSPIKTFLPNGVTGMAGGTAARDMGLGGTRSGNDWMQVRRDVNRSNSFSRNERAERIERCQLMDYPVMASVEEFFGAVEGDEGLDGQVIYDPTDYSTVNLQLVDKNARFVNGLPPMTNAASLAQGYLCRPYRSDVQRLRAIFTWTSEKVAWEEDFEGDVDTRRVIQMRRGCSEEIAVLVANMCAAVGIHAEVVRGYLKPPGEVTDAMRPNHWWNAVVADGQWRIMDCSLASPTNPKRSFYSSVAPQVAESGFFLARPLEICYTHIPSNFEHQHLCPAVSPEILLALPSAYPPYFRHGLQITDFDTSLYRIDNLEMVQIQFIAPFNIECVAVVESRSYARDTDGDFFESGDINTTRALAQAEWVAGQKRFTVKAHLPGDEGHGVLKVYAGKRGLMHSVKSNPHPLAFTLPIIHTGDNPPYEFFLRHPTPHAQRHDLYVSQPQCRRLALNNTFVFAVRQHPSSPSDCLSPSTSEQPRSHSPAPFARPSSAMSMVSAAPSDYFSQASSNSSNGGNGGGQAKAEKPAKLAIQAPSGKIMRLMRKSEGYGTWDVSEGGTWETIIKVGEIGVWRGLVLADRSARWCVFGEWDCV